MMTAAGRYFFGSMRTPCRHGRPNKGMKLTKPEHIGALQLIPGVVRTMPRAMGGLPMHLARSIGAVILMAGVARTGRAGELEAREAPLFAAAILHMARPTLCTPAEPCCYSVAGAVPSAELIKLLQPQRHLKPIPPRSVCTEAVIDAGRVSRTAEAEQEVSVDFGLQDHPLMFCTYTLRLDAAGWRVTKSVCPVT
jgi:hypothetical protein